MRTKTFAHFVLLLVAVVGVALSVEGSRSGHTNSAREFINLFVYLLIGASVLFTLVKSRQ